MANETSFYLHPAAGHSCARQEARPLWPARPLAKTALAPRHRPTSSSCSPTIRATATSPATAIPCSRRPPWTGCTARASASPSFTPRPCAPPRAGQLLSGQDACHNGATSVTAGRAVLRRGIPTMGDVFSASGYATGVFGKWHLGDTYPYRPMDRGFQEANYFHGFGM